MHVYLSRASDKNGSSRKPILPAVAVVTLTLVLAGLIVAWRSHRQHVHDREIAAMAAEPAKLNQAVASGTVTPKERDAALLDQARQSMRDMVDDYFAASVGKPREAYLDQVIDRSQQERRKRTAQPSRPNRLVTPPALPDRDQLEFIEKIPPAEEARMAQFAGALMSRMLKRGIGISAEN